MDKDGLLLRFAAAREKWKDYPGISGWIDVLIETLEARDDLHVYQTHAETLEGLPQNLSSGETVEDFDGFFQTVLAQRQNIMKDLLRVV